MSLGTEAERNEPSDALATFIADLEFGDLPAEAVDLVERIFVDTVGVTLPGTADAAGTVAAEAILAAGSGGEARLLCQDADAAIGDAAFVNGIAGHALDFDDVSTAMNGHPSVTMIAPLLAVGEAENASGEDLITAFVAGFETQCYIAGPIVPEHYEAGWHATSTFGTFGAAAATAQLLGANESTCRNALNIAASMPAGVKRNLGSMTKPGHAGQAARSGVTAALLADKGFTANQFAIGGQDGFYDLYGATDPDWDEQYELANRWAIVEDGVHVKKYPCCYATHSSIEAASQLSEEHDIDPADVADVTVVAFPGAGDALQHANPRTGLEAKFSMEYTVACAIARDRVGLAAFDDEQIDNPDVQSIRELVTFEVDDSLPYNAFSTTVTIETTEGETYERGLSKPPGTHDDPLSEEELAEKFRMCGQSILSTDEVETLYEGLSELRTVDNISNLLAAL